MLAAFHGKPEVRAAALARLDARLAARQLTAGALYRGADAATPAAALVDSADAPTWQAELGLPQWLAYAIDYCFGRMPAEQAVQGVHRLLDAIEPGSDLTRLAGRVVDDVLASVAQELEARGEAAQPLRSACDGLRTLHRLVSDGEAPPPAAWRAARKAATQATNALEDPLDKSLGGCVEAAAWDPLQAPTTVGDVLRLRGQVPSEHLDRVFGWTAEDDQRTRRLLGEMHQSYIVGKPDERRDVFMLLREHHPQDEARLLAYTRYQNAENASAAVKAADLLLATLGARS
ncbi:hypothetical protein CLD22_12145 [Rubrivivax gelatinosus]|nr:hypothetical protein [Rubrivivax gelatinosus]